jgi:glyoxylase-like metal-dependent hydrolase (beta-lactamase superfamily II)
VEKNRYWVTDGTYQAAFLTTREGVVLFDAPPTIGHNLQRAIDQIASANGVSNTVTHIVYSHHHADHLGASSLFGRDVVRIGHIETKRLLARDNDPYGNNSWAAVKTYQAAQVDYAAAPVIKKYTGVLAAADVYTASTAFIILESIRLDLGLGSQVHP